MASTKPFFWENKANLETLQKPTPYIWVSYIFVLKSVNSLNRILWATEYWFKALKCQIWLTNTKPFSWENEANLETLQKLSMYLSFLSSCFEVCQKPKSNLMSYGILVQGFKMPNLVDEYKTIFLVKRGKRWNSPKLFSLYLSFL